MELKPDDVQDIVSDAEPKKTKPHARKHPLLLLNTTESGLANEIMQWEKEAGSESDAEQESLGFLYPTKNDSNFLNK